MPTFADAALLILGHGSTQNADSATPTYRHALEISRRDIFKNVHVSFWKEEPNFRAALRAIESPITFIVPNFISSGYFTEEIIPRELALTGPITRTPSHTLAYCSPVGLHPSMTNALLHRAQEIAAPHNPPSDHTALFIVGHGTSLNENSTQIIYQQVEAIRRLAPFIEVHATFMEQAPFIKDWRTITAQPNIIVVPFFISDGLHSFEDIPVLLGMTDNVRATPFRNPHRFGDRTLWYARAIGTDAFIADIILDSVQSFVQEHPEIFSYEIKPRPITHNLTSWLAAQTFPYLLGPVAIHKEQDRYFLTAKSHQSTPRLIEGDDTESIIENLLTILKISPSGDYRFLTTAPDIFNDWKTKLLTIEEIIIILRYILPNALIDRYLYENQALPITPIQETTGRQTGMYRRTSQATQEQIQATCRRLCQAQCGKIPVWNFSYRPALEPSQIPCAEACNAFIGALREKMSQDYQAAQNQNNAAVH